MSYGSFARCQSKVVHDGTSKKNPSNYSIRPCLWFIPIFSMPKFIHIKKERTKKRFSGIDLITLKNQ